MYKLAIVAVLFLGWSFSFAKGFDWMSISEEINVGNEYNAVVSKTKYGARWESDGHCRQLGRQLGLEMRLADFQEVIKIAAYGKPTNTDMMVQVRQNDGTVKYGIVAWDSQKPIKVDTKNPGNKDTSVVFTFRGGSGATVDTSITEMNQSEVTVVDYQGKRFDKIPAFCVHNKK